MGFPDGIWQASVGGVILGTTATVMLAATGKREDAPFVYMVAFRSLHCDGFSCESSYHQTVWGPWALLDTFATTNLSLHGRHPMVGEGGLLEKYPWMYEWAYSAVYSTVVCKLHFYIFTYLHFFNFTGRHKKTNKQKDHGQSMGWFKFRILSPVPED